MSRFVITCDADYYSDVKYADTMGEAESIRDELFKEHGAHYDNPARVCIAEVLHCSVCDNGEVGHGRLL